MKMTKQELFTRICVLALVLSTSLQAIGLTWMAVSWLSIENWFVIVGILAASSLVGLLPDTIMIIAKVSEDLGNKTRNFFTSVGMFFSAILSLISSFAGVSASSQNGFFGVEGWAILASLFIIQIVILIAEWLTKDALLATVLGDSEDFEIQEFRKQKTKIKALADEYNLPDEAAEKLELIVENLDDHHGKVGQSFAEIMAVLQAMNSQITVIENRPLPKLSAPSSGVNFPHSDSDNGDKIAWLIMNIALVRNNAFTLGNLAKMWGWSDTKQLKKLIEEAEAQCQ